MVTRPRTSSLVLVLVLTACGSEGASSRFGSASASLHTPIAGELTAGAWDDNLNFDFFLSYLRDSDASYLPGALTIPREDRLELVVLDADGAPVPGAAIVVQRDGQQSVSTTTGADGRVFAYPEWTLGKGAADVKVTATLGEAHVDVVVPAGTARAELALPTLHAQPLAALDVALVLDTTGSMGDEIDWLRAEANAVADAVKTRFPGVNQRWALITYRDEGDDYVTRVTPFGAVDAVREALQGESASGGGDYPEALDTALSELTHLSWRGGATARVAFVITDAPHHGDATHAGALETDLLEARRLGLRIYPVAASGLDLLGEHTLRTAAQLTGGRYLFLTDDSGVGDTHQEPTLPCYVVTPLDAQLRRVLAAELTGRVEQPSAREVIRTGGDPTDGRCTLANGTSVQMF